MPRPEDAGDAFDLRAIFLGAGAWGGALLAPALPAGWWAIAVAGLGVCALACVRWRPRPAALALAVTLSFAACGTSAALVGDSVTESALAGAAEHHRSGTITMQLVSDPKIRTGQFEDYVLLRARAHQFRTGSTTVSTRQPVLVFASADREQRWTDVQLGATVRTRARLRPAEDDELAAMVQAQGAATQIHDPGWWWDAAAAVRSALRASVAGLPADQRALVPALVVGDDSRVGADLATRFRTTGLTHLLAVSGTNLTLIVGFLVIVARWLRVRGRGLMVVGAVGIVAFIVIARSEPSVVRAAAMGTVALLGMGRHGRSKGVRSLGLAMTGLLLVQPHLAYSVGFALSALATAGILLLAPSWRDALAAWLPRWVAEIIAVPAAAQLAVTPIVAAISGQVSLVAVIANMAAAPAVGPATVLGFLAGLIGLLFSGAAALVGRVAGWCVAWIVTVADFAAGLPVPALNWGTSAFAIAALAGASIAIMIAAPRVLARPRQTLACGLVAVLVVGGVVPRPDALAGGFPGDNWRIAMCDVGQGDGFVIRVQAHAALVIDTGPEAPSMKRCLDRLGVRTVPLVVLTHFHADHVGGLAGVLDGRAVEQVWTSSLPEPADQAHAVAATLAAADVPVTVAPRGRTVRWGDVTVQVLWPPGHVATDEPNDASVTLLVQIAGRSALFTGDIEPASQDQLRTRLGALRVDVDVLKVPHHGSRYQSREFLESWSPEFSLISAGADNDYGHPAASTVSMLKQFGSEVLRTDLRGSISLAPTAKGWKVHSSD